MTETAAEKVNICEGERVDDTGFGQLRLIQKPEEFCYGVDAVILADFASKYVVSAAVRNGSDVAAVDLGTGTGIIPVILSHKTRWASLTGLEVQPGSYDRACRFSGAHCFLRAKNLQPGTVLKTGHGGTFRRWFLHLPGQNPCKLEYIRTDGGYYLQHGNFPW